MRRLPRIQHFEDGGSDSSGDSGDTGDSWGDTGGWDSFGGNWGDTTTSGGWADSIGWTDSGASFSDNTASAFNDAATSNAFSGDNTGSYYGDSMAGNAVSGMDMAADQGMGNFFGDPTGGYSDYGYTAAYDMGPSYTGGYDTYSGAPYADTGTSYTSGMDLAGDFGPNAANMGNSLAGVTGGMPSNQYGLSDPSGRANDLLAPVDPAAIVNPNPNTLQVNPYNPFTQAYDFLSNINLPSLSPLTYSNNWSLNPDAFRGMEEGQQGREGWEALGPGMTSFQGSPMGAPQVDEAGMQFAPSMAGAIESQGYVEANDPQAQNYQDTPFTTANPNYTQDTPFTTANPNYDQMNTPFMEAINPQQVTPDVEIVPASQAPASVMAANPAANLNQQQIAQEQQQSPALNLDPVNVEASRTAQETPQAPSNAQEVQAEATTAAAQAANQAAEVTGAPAASANAAAHAAADAVARGADHPTTQQTAASAAFEAGANPQQANVVGTAAADAAVQARDAVAQSAAGVPVAGRLPGEDITQPSPLPLPGRAEGEPTDPSLPLAGNLPESKGALPSVQVDPGGMNTQGRSGLAPPQPGFPYVPFILNSPRIDERRAEAPTGNTLSNLLDMLNPVSRAEARGRAGARGARGPGVRGAIRGQAQAIGGQGPEAGKSVEWQSGPPAGSSPQDYTNAKADNPSNHYFQDKGLIWRQGEPGVAWKTAQQANITPKFQTGDHNWQSLSANFVSRLNAAYDAMPDAAKATFELNSSYRTGTRAEARSLGMTEYRSQESVWARSNGGRSFDAARPGFSNHGRGDAVDIKPSEFFGDPNRDALTWIQQHASEFGLQGIRGGLKGSDPVHIELAPSGRDSVVVSESKWGTGTAASPGKSGVPLTATSQALSSSRSNVMADLKANPRSAATLVRMAYAEAGSQGPQAVQAFMESVINAVAANQFSGRGPQSIVEVLDKKSGYFPASTYRNADRANLNASNLANLNAMLNAIGRGSNVSNFATGNASRSGAGREVMFGSGPQTAAYGPAGRAERYGIESANPGHMAWAQSVGYRGPASLDAQGGKAAAIAWSNSGARGYYGSTPSGAPYALAGDPGLTTGAPTAVAIEPPVEVPTQDLPVMQPIYTGPLAGPDVRGDRGRGFAGLPTQYTGKEGTQADYGTNYGPGPEHVGALTPGWTSLSVAPPPAPVEFPPGPDFPAPTSPLAPNEIGFQPPATQFAAGPGQWGNVTPAGPGLPGTPSGVAVQGPGLAPGWTGLSIATPPPAEAFPDVATPGWQAGQQQQGVTTGIFTNPNEVASQVLSEVGAPPGVQQAVSDAVQAAENNNATPAQTAEIAYQTAKDVGATEAQAQAAAQAVFTAEMGRYAAESEYGQNYGRGTAETGPYQTAETDYGVNYGPGPEQVGALAPGWLAAQQTQGVPEAAFPTAEEYAGPLAGPDVMGERGVPTEAPIGARSDWAATKGDDKGLAPSLQAMQNVTPNFKGVFDPIINNIPQDYRGDFGKAINGLTDRGKADLLNGGPNALIAAISKSTGRSEAMITAWFNNQFAGINYPGYPGGVQALGRDMQAARDMAVAQAIPGKASTQFQDPSIVADVRGPTSPGWVDPTQVGVEPPVEAPTQTMPTAPESLPPMEPLSSPMPHHYGPGGIFEISETATPTTPAPATTPVAPEIAVPDAREASRADPQTAQQIISSNPQAVTSIANQYGVDMATAAMLLVFLAMNVGDEWWKKRQPWEMAEGGRVGEKYYYTPPKGKGEWPRASTPDYPGKVAGYGRELRRRAAELQRADAIVNAVHINPENWDRFIRESPRSTNIEDRRREKDETEGAGYQQGGNIPWGQDWGKEDDSGWR